MLGTAAALLKPPLVQPPQSLSTIGVPPSLRGNQSFLLPQPAGGPIAVIDAAQASGERLLLVPTQLPLGARVASVPASLVARGGSGIPDQRISVIVMPTGHLMLADAMALPAGLSGEADSAANAASAAAAAMAAAAAAAAVASRGVSIPTPSPTISLRCGGQTSPTSANAICLVKSEAAEEPALEEDHCADGDDEAEMSLEELSRRPDQHRSVVDGVDLNEIGQFAREFKLRRLRLGLTQTQIGAALSAARGPAYSQSAISRFEKLDVTPRSAARIKQALQTWLTEAEDSAMLQSADEEGGHYHQPDDADYEEKEAGTTIAESADAASIDDEAVGMCDVVEPSGSTAPADNGAANKRPRKRRTSFTPEALEALNSYFELNRHPSGAEVTQLARALRYTREVIRVWFCNRRQALRANTVKRLRPPVASTGSAAAAAAVAAAAAAAASLAATASSASSMQCIAAPVSSPSPSDSPVNLSQQPHPLRTQAQLTSTVPASSSPKSPNSVLSAPTSSPQTLP